MVNPAMNWMFETEPEDSSGNRRIAIPRGKVLGGSSAINAMLYVRGQAAVFGFGFKHPIHCWIDHCFNIASWNMDQRVKIFAARLKKNDMTIRISAQARCQHTACRPAANYDIIRIILIR